MSQNQNWDGIVGDLAVSYNRLEKALSTEPRYIRGQNFFVTPGGALSRRPGTIAMTNGALPLRVDRAWGYETLDTPPACYIVVSAYNPASGKWELWYQRLTNPTPGAWTQVPSLRDCNVSSAPHEACVSRGLLFVKGYPTSVSTEKLGTIVVDGTGGTVVSRFWGLIGPTTPAKLKGAVTKATAAVAIGDGTITVGTSVGSFPATPFVAGIDFEQVNVTNVSGSTWTVTRAYNGTVATAHAANSICVWRNWSASDHLITVSVGWEYSYSYKSVTGQYSNRAPAQTNPDNYPSTTGPFFNQQPVFTLHGHADTVNVPTIAVWRKLDGGGVYYKLDEVANPGDVDFDYTDNTLGSGSAGTTKHDPVPDSQLNQQNYAPDLNSNSPPPTVLAPKVTGTDAPARTSPIASFQGRLWMAIGNVLFYSANEEMNLGVQEECWPTGSLGNFIRFQHPITNLAATDSALYVFSLQATYMVEGSDRQTFSDRILFDNYGHPYGHPRGVIRFGDTLAFLTHDYRVAVINGTTLEVASDPLFSDLVDTVNTNAAEFDLKYYADLNLELLFVTGHVAATPSLSRQWVLDIKRTNNGRARREVSPYFWNVPWTFPSTACYSGRINELSSQRRMCFFNWNTGTLAGQWSRMDPTLRTGTDYLTSGATNFDLDIVSHLQQNPVGNHVNEKRLPGLTTVVYSVEFDRLLFSGDSDMNFYYFMDDLWADPQARNDAEDPARRAASKGYKTMAYPVWNACQRFAWEITKVNTADLFEIHEYRLIFEPDSGA